MRQISHIIGKIGIIAIAGILAGSGIIAANWHSSPIKNHYIVVFHTHFRKAGIIVFNGVNYTGWGISIVSNGTYAISASANAGFQFDHWSSEGGISVTESYSSSTTVNVSGNGVLMAWFIPTNSSQCRVVFHINPPNTGTITFNGNSYSNGEIATVSNGTYAISASANAGFQFDHWSSEGGISVTESYSSSTTVNVSGNGVLMAWFAHSEKMIPFHTIQGKINLSILPFHYMIFPLNILILLLFSTSV